MYFYNEYRFNSISGYLKERFGGKVIKLSLDGGFTCPNRDGSKGVGGCLFCSSAGSGEFAEATDECSTGGSAARADGSGEFAEATDECSTGGSATRADGSGSAEASADGTRMALREEMLLLAEKWPACRQYIAYFQSHTNTYAPAEILRQKYEAALAASEKIVGLAIATRPDCLPNEVLELLSELNKRTFLWVELGLQTIHEETAQRMNRCYPLSVYDEAVSKLQAHGIRVVTHLIFGLPGESRTDMLDSVRHVCRAEPFGVKLHLLNVVRDSRLAAEMPDYVPFSSMGDYVGLVCDALELMPPQITIHRLTGDVPQKTLIAPVWSLRKRTVLNEINRELAARGSKQGCRYHP